MTVSSNYAGTKERLGLIGTRSLHRKGHDEVLPEHVVKLYAVRNHLLPTKGAKSHFRIIHEPYHPCVTTISDTSFCSLPDERFENALYCGALAPYALQTLGSCASHIPFLLSNLSGKVPDKVCNTLVKGRQTEH